MKHYPFPRTTALLAVLVITFLVLNIWMPWWLALVAVMPTLTIVFTAIAIGLSRGSKS